VPINNLRELVDRAEHLVKPRQSFAGQVAFEFINAKASFQSAQLTAARKFEIDADVNTIAATNISENIQEMVLGRPALLQAGAPAAAA